MTAPQITGVVIVGWCLASIAAAVVWAVVKGPDRRLASIDLGHLTVDEEPEERTCDETLQRCERYTIPVPWTTDPRRFSTWELQRIHRVQSQDYIDAQLARRQRGAR